MTELEGLGELGRLGQVDPPAPGVLDAAREVLWSAVAIEMLTTAPPDAARPDAERAAGRAADDIASQLGPDDPGVP
jgi:hypothetical protein